MSDLIYYDNKSNKDSMYRTINLYCFRDYSISWKAKGLLCYLMTRPKKWKIWNKDVKKRASNGETSIRSGINELIHNGYVHRGKIYVDGKIKHWVHIVFSEPRKSIPLKTKERIENLFLGNLFVENLKVENQVHRKYITIRKNMNKGISKDIYEESYDSSKENQIALKEKLNQNKAEIKKKKRKAGINLKGFPLRVVKIWNKYKPLTSEIRLNNPSKTQADINNCISALRKGNYLKFYRLSKRWLEKNNIPVSLLKHKFTKKEIIQVIKDMVKYNKKGYWPPSKTGFHKNLNNLLFYMNRTSKECSSCFFQTYKHPPKLLKIKDPNPKLTKMVLETFPDGLREDEKEELYKKIDSFVFFWKNRLNERKLDTDTFKTPESMMKTYLVFLEKDDWCLEIIKKGGILNLIGSKKLLYRFVYDLEATWTEGKGYLTGKYTKPPELSKEEQKQLEKAERKKEKRREKEEIEDMLAQI